MKTAVRPIFRHYLAKRFIKKTVSNGGSVIDIGSGRGDFSFWLAKKGYRVTSFEFSENSVMSFKKELEKLKNNKPELIDSDFLKYEGHFSAHAIVCFEVLEHIDDDYAAVSRMHDWMRENGTVIISVPAHMKMWNKDDEVVGHKRRYERSDLKKLFESSGFEVVYIVSYGFPWLNILKKIREIQMKLKPPSYYKPKDGSYSEKGTKESGVGFFKTNIFLFVFNKFTFYPLYLVSKLFHKTDLSEGYFLVAKKIS
ncbi:MAG: hypothetical protein COU07_03285 [Candidatus Harrisonbacteria bacterium CG10_big_fil_rev_8_21_14_0_10_40_38]|uniref:Methyltransferase type 11 domain-containing protein n=1 Tax=Candidatus Harrisonbacteria bacterium CG10_big_fil_rev_8_21_14_0_10_40_38 TaxID=1974583 RepID=A0A2H0UR66_9BACT|nr:MAG: hypothetical protein COU07_03285 [Candidatus Harrisonbacteria bacterium CG10_big_fil_rev_8_21_14_0_10_40_38]